MPFRKSNPVALLPLLLFLVIFIGAGVLFTLTGKEYAFYQVSATVAIFPAIILAVFISREPLNGAIEKFMSGVGNPNIITMCMIYLLAGAFGTVARQVGCVESTVNLGLALIPSSLILPGLFVTSAFIATAMGTSMGTIAAIAPIAVGVADRTGMGMALCVAAVAGGAMFGDNLSMISDTTIAATRTQDVEMKDKFRINLYIALPAAVITIVILYLLSGCGRSVSQGEFMLIRVVPYILILVMAAIGINVFVVLISGIIITGIVGLATTGGYTILLFSQDIYKGFTGMQEILILSLLIGGLGELIHHDGGIDYLIRCIRRITSRFSKTGESRLAGEIGISSLVSLADICLANNTVAIILTGRIARTIAEKNGVDPKRSASLLDIFSCVFQGLIPYGAQILLAGSIAKISPLEVIGRMHYCHVLGIVAVISIAAGYPGSLKKAAVSK